MKHIYTSLDIGSDTVKIVVCELFNNKLNLLAASSVKAKGIEKGLIVDVYAISSQIKEAIEKIEQMLGITIRRVITSVPSYNSEYVMVKGSTNVLNGEVSGEDVLNVLDSANRGKKIANKEMVTTIPIDFSVDGKGKLKDPKGIEGTKLETRAIKVFAPKKNIYSVLTLLDNMGIEVVDISTSCVGDIFAIRNKEIENSVGAVINIGHETTTISLYNKGIVVKSAVLGLGGRNIDNDIAYIYKLSQNDSVMLKENFASASKNVATKNEMYEIENKLGDRIKINQYEISEVVMSRIEEILVKSRKEINILTKREIDYIMITGGTSNMVGFEDTAKDVLGELARVGSINIVGIRNNKYTTALGNIVYFICKLGLKGNEYSMISESDMEELSQPKEEDGLSSLSENSMLGKLFGYFFND